MDRSLALEVLNDWNFWEIDRETGRMRRHYINQCMNFLKIDIITTIIGVRRSGKSYLMRQIIKELISRGVERRNLLLINFEDVRFPELSIKLLDELYELYLEVLKPSSKPYIFLDEIHNIPGWERWVRTIHELNKARIIISGSSSKLLGGELSTLLTGRHLDINMYPLSFQEYLSFKNIDIRDELDIVSRKIDLKRALSEYSKYGGFPEVVIAEEKKQLLLTYFDDIITKDIERRYEVRRGDKLRALARFYLTNISKLITFNSLSKTLDISKNTVEIFSRYLEDVFLVFLIKKFSYSFKEQEKSPRKIYSIDQGLSNTIGFRFTENKGRLMENIASIEFMRKKTLNPNLEIYYWKDYQQREVDFVVKEGLEVKQLVQVTYANGRDEVESREVRSLIRASEQLRCKDLKIITWDYEDKLVVDSKTIKCIPLWKWLLSKNI